MIVQESTFFLPLILEGFKKINPVRIILLGSQAQSTAQPDSDLELLVVTNDDFVPQHFHEKEKIYLGVFVFMLKLYG